MTLTWTTYKTKETFLIDSQEFKIHIQSECDNPKLTNNNTKYTYHQISNISHTKSQNLNVSYLVL